MKLTFRHTILSCYMAYISSAIVNNLASLLFFTFKTFFGLSDTMLATLLLISFAVQILMDTLGAGFAEKIGYRSTAVAAGIFMSAGLVCLGVLPNIIDNKFVALIISAFIYAIGSGINELIISPLIEAIPGDAKESKMSILHSFYSWGQVLVVVLSTVYLVNAAPEKWYLLPILWSVFPAFTAISFAVVPIRMLSDNTPSISLKELFENKSIRIFILLMICGGAAEVAMAEWASLFAEEALGVSKAVGNMLGPCFFAVMMGICRVLYGKFGEKIPLVSAIAFCGALTCIGYLMVSLVPNPYIALTGCGVIGFGVGIFWPGVLSVSSKRIPGGGTLMFGILALGGDIGCSVVPELAAITADLFGGNLKHGLLACTVFPLIITVVTIIMILQNRKISDNKEISGN